MFNLLASTLMTPKLWFVALLTFLSMSVGSAVAQPMPSGSSQTGWFNTLRLEKAAPATGADEATVSIAAIMTAADETKPEINLPKAAADADKAAASKLNSKAAR